MALDLLSGLLGCGFLLYAETHYSFRGLYSRLKRREPEIIADAPHRVEPGQPLPVLLLVKDAHRYPLALHCVTLTLTAADGKTWRRPFHLHDLEIGQPLWWRLFRMDAPESGKMSLDVEIEYSLSGRRRHCHNDNHIGTSHEPLSVLIASQPLPRHAGWINGDLHTHSTYTHDQVEFGAPIAAAVNMAKAMGLGFFAVTDHSYDLDDHTDDYLSNDPNLEKWQALWEEVEEINRQQRDVVVLPGEEVSCANARGRNVHFLVLNSRRFFPGSGDGAERWLRTRPEMSIEEVLDQLSEEALAIAAHPAARPPFLQWLLVQRGFWEDVDCRHPDLAGLQVWNGSDVGLREGLEQWVRQLLAGQRLYLYGGNDAHGNFNRFRQIGFPFFTMREHHDHLFGKVRTAVHVHGERSVEAILAALRGGRCMVTDGPFVSVQVDSHNGEVTRMGGTASGGGLLRILARSTAEFGRLRRVRVYRGVIGQDREEIEREMVEFDDAYALSADFPLRSLETPSYVRAEVETGDKHRRHWALSNPIWVE